MSDAPAATQIEYADMAYAALDGAAGEGESDE